MLLLFLCCRAESDEETRRPRGRKPSLKKKRKKETKERKRSLLHSLGRKCRNKQCRLHKNDTRLAFYYVLCMYMVVLDLDRVAERPALGLRWPRPCIIIGGATAAALKGSRDITLVKLYRRTAAAATKALVATILFLFVFKALFYTHGRLLLLESFSIERSGGGGTAAALVSGSVFGYYVLVLLAHGRTALCCVPSSSSSAPRAPRRPRQRQLDM